MGDRNVEPPPNGRMLLDMPPGLFAGMLFAACPWCCCIVLDRCACDCIGCMLLGMGCMLLDMVSMCVCP